MPIRKTEILCEKGTGAELFTSREAARFLNYHPVAFRTLVSRGKICVHSRTGNYPLFLREELERYQLTNKWAGKKAKIKPAAAPLPAADGGIRAVVTARLKGKETELERSDDFKWGDVPAIRARVSARHGKVPFRIELQLPDCACTIAFRAPAGRAKSR